MYLIMMSSKQSFMVVIMQKTQPSKLMEDIAKDKVVWMECALRWAIGSVVLMVCIATVVVNLAGSETKFL